MTKMNYGKRFGQGPVSATHKYDRAMDQALFMPKGMKFAKSTPEQAALRAGKASARRREKQRKAPAPSTEYQEAQARLVERVKVAIVSIQFGLDECNAAMRSAGPKQEVLISRAATMEAVRRLKLLLKAGDPPEELFKRYPKERRTE